MALGKEELFWGYSNRLPVQYRALKITYTIKVMLFTTVHIINFNGLVFVNRTTCTQQNKCYECVWCVWARCTSQSLYEDVAYAICGMGCKQSTAQLQTSQNLSILERCPVQVAQLNRLSRRVLDVGRSSLAENITQVIYYILV